MTEHCECGAPPDGSDEQHACVKSAEPLNVRCARALGTLSDGHALVYEHAEGCARAAGDDAADCMPSCAYVCTDCGSRQPAGQKWDRTCAPPYGEDTPEGWACTGPFIRQYGLGLSIPRACPGVEGGVVVFATGARGRDALGPHACAAIAYWVAEHGAKEPAC